MSLKVQQKCIEETEKYIREFFKIEESGHDWWHIFRVRNLALEIVKSEGGDIFMIEMAALLHDLDDWKLNGDSNVSKAKIWLDKFGISRDQKEEIFKIIEQVSFKGANVVNRAFSVEAKIVQDADRLDAIGAIGIARTFAYGGSRDRLMYDPSCKPTMHDDFESYKNSTAPTINHFYEKLLLLKDRMNTNAGKRLAEGRHNYMKVYLEEFFA